MAQVVTGTQSITNPDGSSSTVTTYSDGSTSVSWAPAAGSPAANQQTLRSRGQAALASNATYLALAAPTAAQTAAQVKALTRQVDAILRLSVVQDTSDISDS